MSDVSPELNQVPPNKDQYQGGKNADKSVKARLKSAAGKIILGTPLAALILSSGNVDNPNVPAPNIKEPTPAVAPSPDFKSQIPDTLQPYPLQAPTEIPTTLTTTPESTPIVTQSPLVTHALEQGVSIEDYIQQKLTSALERASLELEFARIDFNKEITLDEINQIAKEAIPYLEEVLQVEKAHVPSIGRGKSNTYHYNPLLRTGRIEIGGGPLFMKKTSVIHELVHAQRRTKPRSGNWAVSPGEEEFAETAAWAVLAKQALNGDSVAKYALTMNVLCNLNAMRGKGEYPVCNGNSGYRPVAMVMDALKGKSSSYYGNVSTDGIVEFIKKDVLETNSK